jgi:hypothetical protein
LNLNGSQDHLLSIQDLPDITVGDWQKAPEGTAENPAVVNDDNNDLDTIEVDDNDEDLLYTMQEVEQGVTINVENEGDVAIDSGDESDQCFDYNSKSSFDDNIDGDEDEQDEDME